MTADQLAAMAREAGMEPGARGEWHTPLMDGIHEETLARFASLVLEEAAKVCEELRLICPNVQMQRDQTAAAIRALAQQAGGSAAKEGP